MHDDLRQPFPYKPVPTVYSGDTVQHTPLLAEQLAEAIQEQQREYGVHLTQFNAAYIIHSLNLVELEEPNDAPAIGQLVNLIEELSPYGHLSPLGMAQKLHANGYRRVMRTGDFEGPESYARPIQIHQGGRMTTNNPEAGRELDIRILQEVFGMDKNVYVFGEIVRYNATIAPGARQSVEVPHFSTDPTACQTLKLKMMDRFHWRILSPFNTGDKWFAGLSQLGVTGWNGRPDFEGEGDTEMLAVCRAALLAVGA